MPHNHLPRPRRASLSLLTFSRLSWKILKAPLHKVITSGPLAEATLNTIWSTESGIATVSFPTYTWEKIYMQLTHIDTLYCMNMNMSFLQRFIKQYLPCWFRPQASNVITVQLTNMHGNIRVSGTGICERFPTSVVFAQVCVWPGPTWLKEK